MNEQFVSELKKLLNCFPESYINRSLEVILIPKTNTYFSLVGCENKRDIIAKVLMWCTRDIAKARPYQQQKRNITLENFVSVATYTDYSSDYGAQHVPKDLVLVGEDWWIERYEYDGAEWWDFKSIPARKQYMKNITNLHKGMWATLKEMNEE